MRIKLLLVLAVVAALGLTAPAHADFTGQCNDAPYFCVGVDQRSYGTYSGTFLVVYSFVAGAFAGHESDPADNYEAAGACGGVLIVGGCVVARRQDGLSYLTIDSPAGCTTIPLDGGTHDFCDPVTRSSSR